MRYGVREICDVVFKATADMTIGGMSFKKGQPVLYIDSAKTSTLEGASTSVYATGGRGNTRLATWEGEKTLTFTVEDALLSPISFAVLSGAGLFKKADTDADNENNVYVHMTATALAADTTGVIDLTNFLNNNETISDTAPVFVMGMETDGSLNGHIYPASASGKTVTAEAAAGKTVFIDFYIQKTAANVAELQIDAENFAGYYYVEANTLFRRQTDGVDAPVVITLPNVKIQSNFTFTMAATGDPSTFTFTMDAMPGYTMFDKTKRVLCVMQIVEDGTSLGSKGSSVMDTYNEGYDDPSVEHDPWNPVTV